MMDVLIFSGTTEGRRLAELLHSHGVPVHVRVATQYGATAMGDTDVDVLTGSCGGADGIAATIRENGYGLVVDATHPFARRISAHISQGCEAAGVECIRLLRHGKCVHDGVVEVPTVEAAIDHLIDKEGNILALTGSNDLRDYTRIPDYRDRVFVRILSTRASFDNASELGFEGRHLIAAQGPFSEGENIAAIHRADAKWVVTKDSGTVGGFEEKVRAARKTGATLVVVTRPSERGYGYEKVLSMLEERLGTSLGSIASRDKRRLTIVGIGMGPGDLTLRAEERLRDCDLVIGAERMLGSVDHTADTLREYRAEAILGYLKEHPEYRDVVCLMSGDTGFYSGTKGLLAGIDRNVFDVDVECGISSVVYMASKLEETWQDAYLTSAHGRDSNLVGLCNTHGKVFTLLSGEDTVHAMCAKFLEYDMDVEVAIGQDFGYPTERVVRGSPRELMDMEFGDLCVAMVFNGNPDRRCPIGIPDEEFVRGDAPMTKSDVRALSVAKLKLTDDSVVYDVGAGTGSVSVEMALVAVNGKVYAIEREQQAAELIAVNKRRFRTDNLEVVTGLAPEALADLPAPTHAFIGGSAGNLKRIVQCLLDKNPDVRIVINSVTIETIAETMDVIRDLGLVEEEITCINSSRSRSLGRYHLMTAQNPVYIAVVRGR